MKIKIRKYCFFQYFWLIIWTIPKNVNFDQKMAVRGAISQKEGIEILQDAPHIKAFWNPDQVVSSAFMEMKVTLEEGCAWSSVPTVSKKCTSLNLLWGPQQKESNPKCYDPKEELRENRPCPNCACRVYIEAILSW